jgi:hypothetical protein
MYSRGPLLSFALMNGRKGAETRAGRFGDRGTECTGERCAAEVYLYDAGVIAGLHNPSLDSAGYT